MKRIIVFLLLITSTVFADDRGKFSNEIHIRSSTSTSATDTTMIDSVSFIYRGWPTMTIFYMFDDTATVATTLYFETELNGNLASTWWAITDSLQVTTTVDSFKTWNITDGAIGVTDRWRLRKSVTSDTLIAIFRGYNPNFD